MSIRKAILISTAFFLFLITLPSCSTEKQIEQCGAVNHESMETDGSKMLTVTILGKTKISIDKSRLTDDVFGTGQLDNRWELSEVDKILSAIKGSWKIGAYAGFVSPTIYFPDLFDENNNLSNEEAENIYNQYERDVTAAKNEIPDITFSIKERMGKATINNYIFSNGVFPSPVGILLSVNRLDDNYPVFIDRTTISEDFYVEYPVIFIKFIYEFTKMDGQINYKPATLVVPSDSMFLILVNGAFYTLERA